MTGLIGIIVDAWDEVRVHRARVVLSLIGIVLAVFAMTATTAAGMIFKQIIQQQTEMYTGRSATLSLYANSSAANAKDIVPAFYSSIEERYQVKYAAQVMNGSLSVSGPSADPELQNSGLTLIAADPDWAIIHRMRLTSGRWITDADGGRLATSVVVNQTLLRQLGQDEGRHAPFALKLPAPLDKQVVVVGVTDSNPYNGEIYLLRTDGTGFSDTLDPASSSLELWVPPSAVDRLMPEIDRLTAAAGLDGQVNGPQDAGFDVVLTGLQILILVLSLFGLFLGALGVLNVGVVTVRQRVREIGVKRALGASTGRIFGSIMLESVLATMLGGLLGIALAVALVNNFPWSVMPTELQPTEAVPFPVAAALQGFFAALAVGALAGLVPAIIAVQAKVIDAIRY